MCQCVILKHGTEVQTEQQPKISKIRNILANFLNVEVGTFESGGCDLDYSYWEAIIARAKPKIETVRYAFFNVLVNDSTHLLREK